MTANMKRLGWERIIEASSPRGLQGRSATAQNGQAAKEEMSAIWRGAGCRKNISGCPAGGRVFHLTSPLIGLPACRVIGSCSGPEVIHSPYQVPPLLLLP